MLHDYSDLWVISDIGVKGTVSVSVKGTVSVSVKGTVLLTTSDSAYFEIKRG